jgi:glucose uptake protein GlcU
MNADKNQLIFLGSVCLIILIMGFLFGSFYQKEKSVYRFENLENLLATLNSDVVPSIVSFGKVKEIDGKKIIVSFNDSVITIEVNENTSIYKMDNGQKEINFDEILVGDELSAKIKINSEKEFFEAESIVFFNKN